MKHLGKCMYMREAILSFLPYTQHSTAQPSASYTCTSLVTVMLCCVVLCYVCVSFPQCSHKFLNNGTIGRLSIFIYYNIMCDGKIDSNARLYIWMPLEFGMDPIKLDNCSLCHSVSAGKHIYCSRLSYTLYTAEPTNSFWLRASIELVNKFHLNAQLYTHH